jgi:hypothetical protein
MLYIALGRNIISSRQLNYALIEVEGKKKPAKTRKITQTKAHILMTNKSCQFITRQGMTALSKVGQDIIFAINCDLQNMCFSLGDFPGFCRLFFSFDFD